MENKMREQLEEILKRAGVEEKSEVFLRQALAIDIPREDGPWLKSTFHLAAVFLKLALGNTDKANRALGWLIFSLGVAYERNK